MVERGLLKTKDQLNGDFLKKDEWKDLVEFEHAGKSREKKEELGINPWQWQPNETFCQGHFYPGVMHGGLLPLLQLRNLVL